MKKINKKVWYGVGIVVAIIVLIFIYAGYLIITSERIMVPADCSKYEGLYVKNLGVLTGQCIGGMPYRAINFPRLFGLSLCNFLGGSWETISIRPDYGPYPNKCIFQF
jgi:hypothetical protein